MSTAIKESIKVILLSVVVLFSAYVVTAALVGPTVAPTGGNITAPLDVSSTDQTKIGGLTLNTGGSTNGLIVSAGNVGIGAANPSSKLHISGGSTVDAEIILEADTSNNNEQLNPFITFNQDGGTHTAFIGLEGNSGTRSSGTIGNAFLIGSEDTDDVDLQFITSDTVRMTILRNNGLVGINTSAPDSALSIKSVSQNAVVNIYGVSAATDYGAVQVSSSGNLNNTSNRPLVLQPNAGKVGIGTTTPSQALSVNGTIYSGIGGFKFPDGTIQASASGVEAYGGFYSKGGGSCTNPNPLTGACSCGAGFTDFTFLSFGTQASFSCGWYEGYTYTGPCGSYSYESHMCWNPDVTAVCGNNIKEGSEVCDGTALNSQSCVTQLGSGYVGSLSCNASCSAYVTSACTLQQGSQVWSSAGTYSFVIPPGVTSLTADIRGSGGGGAGGYYDDQYGETFTGGSSGGGGGGAGQGAAYCDWRMSCYVSSDGAGSSGGDAFLKRGASILVRAKTGAGGSGYSSGGGPAGTTISNGFAVTTGGGAAGGIGGNNNADYGYGYTEVVGVANSGLPGDRLLGSIPVIPGETLTVIIGEPGGGGTSGGGSNGAVGSVSLFW